MNNLASSNINTSVPYSQCHEQFELLLSTCVASHASDIHLCVDEPLRLRLHGSLELYEENRRYNHEEFMGWLSVLLSEQQRAEFNVQGALDFGYTASSGERFRLNIFSAMGKTNLVARHLNNRFLSFDELHLPASLRELAHTRDGLVLVTGATGSGKSTTLAAMINEINQNVAAHILTIEDPVEFIHSNRKSLVRQREILRDTPDFASAVRASLREDPDVILVGEMRDIETMRAALTAAETGHLVFSTLHTQDAVGTVERLVGAFPAEEQSVVRLRLSMCLRGVISQRLVVRADGKGRVPAVEILLVNNAVANHISSGRSNQIYAAIETGAALGMQTLEQSLVQHVVDGLVKPEAVRVQSSNVDVFDKLLKRAAERRS